MNVRKTPLTLISENRINELKTDNQDSSEIATQADENNVIHSVLNDMGQRVLSEQLVILQIDISLFLLILEYILNDPLTLIMMKPLNHEKIEIVHVKLDMGL